MTRHVPPAPRSQITISPVYIREPELLTREQKFPGGFVCNLPVEKKLLMQSAADDLKVAIQFTPPRQRDPNEFVGVVTDLSFCDPQLLLDRYYVLNLALWQERERAKANLMPSKPMRRRRSTRQRGERVAARVTRST